MKRSIDSLPSDLAAAHAMIMTQRDALRAAEARASAAESEAKFRALLIEKLKFTIAKLQHEQFGQSSERSAVLEQLELQLADMEEDAAQAEAAARIAADAAAREKITVAAFERRKPARRPLPEHLPRERIVYPSPSACPCCGGILHKLGEDVTETLELIPRQWKVIQHVREKFSCRSCETITQPPAPSHPIARGRAGPGLLAHILFSKYGLHLPLNRQSAVYAREGIDLDVSTLADWVGASAATLMPLVEAIRAHVFAAERIHADDTTVPVLAKGKTRTGRLWTYVRDDRPFGGRDPPAAAFFYSPDRSAKHPEQHLASYAGLMQADAYAGFNRLYGAARKPGPIIEAACWAHARRKFFDLARLAKAPIAMEAVERIDALFAIEREINGLTSGAPRRAPRVQPSAGHRVGALAARAARQALRPERDRQSDRLQPHPLGRAHALPRRWPAVHDQQRRRACAQAARGRPPQLDLRGLRRRWLPRWRDLHADRNRQAQRRRPPGLAHRCPHAPARSSRQTNRRAAVLELEARAPTKSCCVTRRSNQTRAVNDHRRGLHRMRTIQ